MTQSLRSNAIVVIIVNISVQRRIHKSIYCVKSNNTLLTCHDRVEACQTSPTQACSPFFHCYYSGNDIFSFVCVVLVIFQSIISSQIMERMKYRISKLSEANPGMFHTQRKITLFKKQTQKREKIRCQLQPPGHQLNPKRVQGFPHSTLGHLRI